MRGLSIKREDAVIVAIDFQEKLLANIFENDKIVEAMTRLVKGCKALNVPILVTQQYTKGIGPTTQKLTEALGDFEHIEKTTFSAMKEPSFVKALEATGRKTVIVTGTEAHICVQQTALDLIGAGYTVFGVIDCMSSRTPLNKELGQLRMTQSGVYVTSYEAVLFDMLVDAKDEKFKEVAAIVK